MMNRSMLRTTYGLSVLLTIIGAWLKITHVQGAEEFLIISLLASAVFLFVFISDVQRSPYVNRSEKFMWTIGFIFMGWLAGLLYLIKYRRLHRNA